MMRPNFDLEILNKRSASRSFTSDTHIHGLHYFNTIQHMS